MRRLAALATGLLVVVVLVVAQLVLPGIAAQRLRDRLARSGEVLSVTVPAFPAIELLWHHADTVVVRLGRYHPRVGTLGGALDQAGDVGSLTASAQEVDYGLLTLRDATLVKHGSRLIGTATVSEAQLRSAIPILTSVTPVASTGGRLTLRGTASLFGLTAGRRCHGERAGRQADRRARRPVRRFRHADAVLGPPSVGAERQRHGRTRRVHRAGRRGSCTDHRM